MSVKRDRIPSEVLILLMWWSFGLLFVLVNAGRLPEETREALTWPAVLVMAAIVGLPPSMASLLFFRMLAHIDTDARGGR